MQVWQKLLYKDCFLGLTTICASTPCKTYDEIYLQDKVQKRQ